MFSSRKARLSSWDAFQNGSETSARIISNRIRPGVLLHCCPAVAAAVASAAAVAFLGFSRFRCLSQKQGNGSNPKLVFRENGSGGFSIRFDNSQTDNFGIDSYVIGGKT